MGSCILLPQCICEFQFLSLFRTCWSKYNNDASLTPSQDAYLWRKHKRVAREYEADLQDAEMEDEDDLFKYDNVFEEMEHSQEQHHPTGV